VKKSKQAVSRTAVIALAVVGGLLVVLAGYFLLIGPQRAKLAKTKKEIADVHQQIDSVQSQTAERKKQPKIRYADLYQLAKAMPDTTDEADTLLALNAIAKASGIEFTDISVKPTVILPSYQTIPIRLEFVGSFYALSDFLYRVRDLVRVRDGRLDASGRLFAVDEIEFGPPPPPANYPTITATLQVSAFVYGNATAAPPSTAPASTDTSSTSTSTGSTDTTATTTTPGQTTPATTTPDTGTPTTSSALGANG
jgi:Tfp pilus assembly protein PilO